MRGRQWAMVLLAPVLLGGCGTLGLSTPQGGSAAAAAGAPSPGPSWIIVAQGSATPSPAPSYPTASPTPGATAGLLPVGGPAPMRTPTSTCSPNTFKFSRIAGADVTPGATSAVVSWYNVGGYNLVQFRLTATSQDLMIGAQRDVGWVTVEPGTPCGQMSAAITGLDRKTGYVFSVDAVVTRRSGDGTHEATIARSGVVYTT